MDTPMIEQSSRREQVGELCFSIRETNKPANGRQRNDGAEPRRDNGVCTVERQVVAVPWLWFLRSQSAYGKGALDASRLVPN